MKTSLRTPTEVYPAGCAIDCDGTDAPVFSFKNNCDSLSWLTLEYIDNSPNSSSHWYEHVPAGNVMLAAHKGDTFRWNETIVQQNAVNGHDYTCLYKIFQNKPSSTNPLNVGEGMYDVFLAAGKTLQGSDSNTMVYLDPDMPIIDAIFADGNLIGGCYINLGDGPHLITDYNHKTGAATLSAATAYYSAAYVPYEIFCNYVQCEPFIFYARSKPTLTISANNAPDGLTCTGVYAQAQNVAMQSYQFAIYVSNTELGTYDLLEQRPKRMTYTFSETFPIIQGKKYKVECIATTQENVSVTKTIEVDLTATTGTITDITFEPNTTYNKISWTCAKTGTFMVFRRKVGDAKNVYIGKVIGKTLNDYTAAYGTDYIYTITIVAADGTTAAASQTLNAVKYPCWSIAKLTYGAEQYGRPKCKVLGNAYSFTVGVDNTTINNVLGISNYDMGGSVYPRASRTGVNYQSGQLTTKLATATDYSITNLDIKTWCEFISEPDAAYILKSPKGDVWIVQLSSDYSRTYNADSELVGITFSWQECDDVEGVIVV